MSTIDEAILDLTPNDWKPILSPLFETPSFNQLKQFLYVEYKENTTYPPFKKMFSAFSYTPFDDIKVVILGQDPYHGVGQANGLCFSVADGISFPPSLINIFKAIQKDLNFQIPMSGNLEKWAKQGVLLLNATLTVRANQAGSHQNKGWELFTDAIIKAISDKKENVVFLLWGNYAKAKTNIIDTSKHLILTSVHPSPLSAHRGFIDCKHFSQTNNFLKSKNINPINWDLS